MTQGLKTNSAFLDREAFLGRAEAVGRRADTERLLDLFGQVTGWQPRLWGSSMVGYGRYDYRYETGHGGSWFATGFSPRKAEISVYILPGCGDISPILSRLGPHRMGKSCLYLKRLDKVDEAVLGAVIRAGLAGLEKLWPVHPV